MSSLTEYILAPGTASKDDRFYIYHRDQLLIRDNLIYWEHAEISNFLADAHNPLLIETLENTRYFALHLEEDFSHRMNAELVPLRKLLLESDFHQFKHPGLGNQLINWYRSNRYCGACGAQTIPHQSERAMVCGSCEQSYYPRINPCVIVLITRGRECLLARHKRFRAQFYSCLAGFIEMGETPEQALVREVREEVGIEVKNIRYIESQPWPFPSQLMLGFFADYESGELRLDPREIEDAAWFSPENLPAVPAAKISVAGELIKRHKEKFLSRDR